jgi:hypothetical protein
MLKEICDLFALLLLSAAGSIGQPETAQRTPPFSNGDLFPSFRLRSPPLVLSGVCSLGRVKKHSTKSVRL